MGVKFSEQVFLKQRIIVVIMKNENSLYNDYYLGALYLKIVVLEYIFLQI